jgi:hypothetical protein
MTSDDFRTLALAVAATISIVTAYHQFLRFRGARLVMLDQRGSTPQKSTILKYLNLPAEIRNQYPDYSDPRGYHALVRIPVANEGDRAGYLKISDVRIQGGSMHGFESRNHVRTSYYTYIVVPAYGIGLHTILLRNLPLIEVDTKISLELDIELGRVSP